MEKDDDKEQGSSLILSTVQAIAISPEKANSIASQYQEAARLNNPNATDEQIDEIVSTKVINSYVRWTSLVGGVSAAPGIILGLGTVAAAVGGGVPDAVLSLKAQVDRTMILAANFG